MTRPVEITDAELALILDALDDAAFYRDSRSHVLRSAKRRNLRVQPSSLTIDTEGGGPDVHQRKAKAYAALAVKLRSKT